MVHVQDEQMGKGVVASLNCEVWRAPVTVLHGVGPARQERLAKLGIETLGDLLFALPRTYRRFRVCRSIESVEGLSVGEELIVEGRAVSVSMRRSRRQRHLAIESFRLVDPTGSLRVQSLLPTRGPLPAARFREGERYGVRGTLRQIGGDVVLAQAEPAALPEHSDDELQAVYPLTRGISHKQFVAWLTEAYQYLMGAVEGGTARSPHSQATGTPPTLEIPPIPAHPGGIPPDTLLAALRALHWPQSPDEPEAARRWLAMAELALLLKPDEASGRRQLKTPSPPPPSSERRLTEPFLAQLPFDLTRAQERVIAEIRSDMQGRGGMHRLLTGDVGTGKTVPIAFALLRGVESGGQGVLIAPTRLLVEQHLRTLGTLYQGLGVRVEQLTSALPPRERRRILDAVANGEIDIVVGTQAAVLPHVAFRRLSIGVVDEQHRFGVRQRSALLEKGAESVLIASATPIPRTMAQALYGGIEISVLDERPPGREPVSSHWIHPERWDDLLRFIRQRIERSEQIFVVCPYIEADDERGEVGAVGMWERLAASLGKEHVDLVHGRMSDEEQSRVMTRFAHGERSVLVATSVVEVGVDVPNATVMIVESAHLFGLAQLHQLRGRVGRGNRPGYALFVSEGPTASARKRLDQLRRCDDGFKLAEYDLWARGPGEYAGLRQWGASDLRFVDLARDLNLFPQIRGWWGERASAIALERWIDSWPPLLRSYLTPADEDLAPVE